MRLFIRLSLLNCKYQFFYFFHSLYSYWLNQLKISLSYAGCCIFLISQLLWNDYYVIILGLLPLTISISAPIGLYVTVHASYLIWRTKNKFEPKLERTQTDQNDLEQEMNSISSPPCDVVSTPALEDIEAIDEMKWLFMFPLLVIQISSKRNFSFTNKNVCEKRSWWSNAINIRNNRF